MKIKLSTPKGFTLIELLVVFLVVGVLSAIGIAAFVAYNKQQTLAQAASTLKNNLRVAQSKALSQEIPASCKALTAYQLRFSDDGRSYTIHPICQEAEGEAIVSVTFPSTIQKTGGPSPIRFRIFTGATDNSGTITLSDSQKTVAIEVTSLGGIK